MYLTVIAWIYVVLLMSIAEATSTTGTVLGALMTFLLYGVLPLAIVMYLMGTPSRRKAIKAKERAQEAAAASAAAQAPVASNQPDASGHAASAADVADSSGARAAAAAVGEKT